LHHRRSVVTWTKLSKREVYDAFHSGRMFDKVDVDSRAGKQAGADRSDHPVIILMPSNSS
jgi:hypothetical protein